MTRGALCAAMLALATAAAAGEPAPPLEPVRDVLAKLHGTDCRAPEAAGLFAYGEIARRALGRHWRDRTEAERAQLVELLRGHVLTWHARFCERRDFVQLGAGAVDGDHAVLSARAIREGRAVSVVYRLRSRDGKAWLVYDVEVAGRSHVRALYAEFDRILLNEGYRDLLARLTSEGASAAPSETSPRIR